MSWHLNVTAKGSDLPKVIAKNLSTCVEPEESIKLKLIDAITVAANSSPDLIFIIESFGTMSYSYGAHNGLIEDISHHSLNLKLTTYKIETD